MQDACPGLGARRKADHDRRAREWVARCPERNEISRSPSYGPRDDEGGLRGEGGGQRREAAAAKRESSRLEGDSSSDMVAQKVGEEVMEVRR